VAGSRRARQRHANVTEHPGRTKCSHSTTGDILGRDSQAPTLSLVPEPLIRSLGDRPFGILFCDRHGEFPQIAVGIETLENTIPVGLVVGLRRNLASMRLAVLVYRY